MEENIISKWLFKYGNEIIRKNTEEKLERLMKQQETIEEASDQYARRHEDILEEFGLNLTKAIFLDGANYQAERMYSEGDKIMKFLDAEKELKLSDAKTIERIKWYFETYFEQFKKK